MTKIIGYCGIISQQDERKMAENCGLEYWGKDEQGRQLFKGTFEQMQEFENQCGLLEEQRENEADIIRENQNKND
jgi:hypothetical protein